MQLVLQAISPQVSRPNNDGSIAALGSVPSNATSGNAGAAIGQAAAVAGLSVAYYKGANEIEQFFADLASHKINPAIIWIAGTGAINDLEFDEGTALSNNAQAIADFVNSGGGLFSHGSGNVAYGWLTKLLPEIQEVNGCTAFGATLTPEGQTTLPTLNNSDIDSNAGPCHSHFTGGFGSLNVLANDGNGRPFILGGGIGTLIVGQIELSPLIAQNPVATTHTITATVTETSEPFGPLEGVLVTFRVISGPNLNVQGTDTTDASGKANFTYTGQDAPEGKGTDEIRASINDETVFSNLSTACWSVRGDSNCDGTIDAMDADLNLLNLVLGKTTPLDDTNNDGKHTNRDGLLIDANVAGLIILLP